MRLPPFRLDRPETLAGAIALTAAGARIVGGGATLLPDLAEGRDSAAHLVSLDRIPGLDELYANPKVGLRIGANVRANRLLPDIWTGKRFAAIHEAVEQMDAPWVGNSATVVGNLCAGRADHDMGVALMALEGVAKVVGPEGARDIPLTRFRAEGLRPGGIVLAIHCPGPGTDAGSAFKKLARGAEPRKVSAAATVTYGVERARIVTATLVLGGLALPRRFPAAETMLAGELPDPALFAAAARAAVADAGLTEPTVAAQAFALMRDALAQANARALARHDHFDDAADLVEEQP